MSNTIWKYRLPRDGGVITIEEYIIEPLRVECQNGVPTLWAVVDPEEKCFLTEIVAWGTGWDLPDDIYYGCEYFGTCEDEYGFVWHYFAKVHRVNSQTTTTIIDEDGCYDNCPRQAVTALNINPSTITFPVDNVDFDGLIKKLEQYVTDRKTINNCAIG